MDYQEGDKARGPNGELAVFSNGKWQVKNATVEDIKNVAVPSLVRGATSLATAGRGMYDTATSGLGWLTDKALPEGAADTVKTAMKTLPNSPSRYNPVLAPFLGPTQEEVMNKVTKATGRKFDEQAETPIGGAVQTGLEIAPSILGGPGTLPRKLAAMVGSTIGSEGGGAIANALDLGPKAEAALRTGGGILGTYSPTIGRRAATPLPVKAEQAAKNAELEAAGISPRAGQATGRGWLKSLEEDNLNSSFVPKEYTPAGQRTAFGQFAQKEAGVKGPQAAQGVTDLDELRGQMRTHGQQIEDIYSRAAVRPTDPALGADLQRIWKKATPDTKAVLEPMYDKLVYRPNPAGTSGQLVPNKGYLVSQKSTTPGPEWRQMENQVGQKADSASNSRDIQTAQALRQFGQALRGATNRSVAGTPDAALPKLRNEYTNQASLERAREALGSTEAAGQPLMPRDVYASMRKSKNPGATKNPLGRVSDTAGQMGIGAPTPSNAEKYAHSAKGAAYGALLGGGGTYLGAGEKEPYGAPILGSIIGGGLMYAGRSNPLMAQLLMNRGTQNWLKNNKYQPGGKHTGLDHSLAAFYGAAVPQRPLEE